MGTITGKKDTIIKDDFRVLTAADVEVPGLVAGDFTIRLYNSAGTEVSGAITVSITDLGNGDYRASYTPNATGLWYLLIIHATYFPEGKGNNHLIFDYDIDGVNVTAISGDSTAADNLELQFDGTGYVDDTAPATQAQLANITNVGSAVNKPASSYVLTTGNQTANTYEETAALDGTRHTHTDDGGSMDLYYEFNVGAGSPASVTVTGALTGLNDNLKIYGYDWVASTWRQIGQLSGKAQSTNEVNSYELYVTMVGTGSDIGKVRIRFYDDDFTLSSATLYIDQIFVSFSQSSGDYASGAIWVDTNRSNTNTVAGIDGISTNPVSTWAAALTLSSITNLKKFHIANGSTITLSANSDNYILEGAGWILALGGQSIEGASFYGANIVTGIGTATVTQPRFIDCGIGAVTLPPCICINCGVGANDGHFTAGSAGQYHLADCKSMVPGASTPVFDFSGLGSTTGVNIRGWLGGTNITLDSDCTMSLEILAGGLQTITTGGANIEVRGICRALTLVLSSSETVRFVGVTGEIGLSGTTTATVELYGVASTLTDTTVTASVTNKTVNRDDITTIDGNVDTLVTRIVGTILAGNHNAQSGDAYAIVNNETYGNSAIETLVDELETRLTAARAGYLDELAAVNIPADIDILIARLTALRAGYLDNLSGGAVALDSTVAKSSEITALDAVVDAGFLAGAKDSTVAKEANVEGHVTDALDTYDPPTRTELTSDKNEIITDLDDIKGTGFVKDTNSLVNIDGGSGLTQQQVRDAMKLAPTTGDPASGSIDKAIDDIQEKTDNLPPGVAKGVALSNFEFVMTNSTDHVTPRTGLTVYGYIAKDGGSFAALTNSISEKAYGIYTVDLTATEMDADMITLRFIATGADANIIVIKTSE